MRTHGVIGVMTLYRERLWPSAWIYISGLLVIPALALVFLRINLAVGILLGAVIYVAYIAILMWSAPIIEITDRLLTVGGARIPVALTGRVDVNDTRDAARLAAGTRLDARAWLCLRGWVPTSASVEITDADDPIPYWLFSTRNPRDVAEALERARTTSDRHLP